VPSTRRAVELDYAIAPDAGRSGRLGHWAIAGVPEAVMELHSKRAAEIQAEMDATGYESYQARNIAARATRDAKRHTPVELLMRRWRVEIEATGWSLEAIAESVERAAADGTLPSPEVSVHDARHLVGQTLDPDGALAAARCSAAVTSSWPWPPPSTAVTRPSCPGRWIAPSPTPRRCR
jgi:hypothetical protein